MAETFLIGIASVLLFGIGAQWVAWRFKMPAILLLLLAGLAAGPLLGLVKPDELMGGLFAPFISVSVAIILFEGGLSLRFSELKETGRVIGTLVSLGALLTWVLIALAAHYILGVSWAISILIGAILVVTGPTVIVPLLRQVRPAGQVGSILKWEGIIIDPIGAMLAVLVFEVILASGLSEATNLALMSIVKTIFFGSAAGLAGAGVVYLLLRRHMLPDFLQNPVSLMIVVTVFTVSNMFQHESGLWATTLMGIALANQKMARINHIIEFKENLRVLLLSALFILLAARVNPEAMVAVLEWEMALFLVVLIVVVRPLIVFLSTFHSSLEWNEKLFLSWMAPRGVVAASISSIFAITLTQRGFSQAEELVPIVFTVILCTVAIYGLSGSWVARKLGVAKPIPNGVIILGAHDWALELARIMRDEEFKVIVADSNWKRIANAEKLGLNTFHGDILAEYVLDNLDLDGIGRLVSLTPNDEVNALAALKFGEILGRSYVFQLPPVKRSVDEESTAIDHLSGRMLFDSDLDFESLSEIIRRGGQIARRTVSGETTQPGEAEGRTPLFLINASHEVRPFTVDSRPSPAPGETLIELVHPEGNGEKESERGEGEQ